MLRLVAQREKLDLIERNQIQSKRVSLLSPLDIIKRDVFQQSRHPIHRNSWSPFYVGDHCGVSYQLDWVGINSTHWGNDELPRKFGMVGSHVDSWSNLVSQPRDNARVWGSHRRICHKNRTVAPNNSSTLCNQVKVEKWGLGHSLQYDSLRNRVSKGVRSHDYMLRRFITAGELQKGINIVGVEIAHSFVESSVMVDEST